MLILIMYEFTKAEEKMFKRMSLDQYVAYCEYFVTFIENLTK